jgi:hypothetical protein
MALWLASSAASGAASHGATTTHALFINETYRRCGVTCNTAVYVHVVEAALALVIAKRMG